VRLWAALTGRGRALAVTGAVAVVLAAIAQHRDLMRVGLLLLAVPLVCLLVVARARYRVELVRTVAPERIPVGTSTSVRLELANLARLSTGVLLAEESLPAALGPRPHFVIDRLAPGDTDPLTVTPAIIPLTPLSAAGAWRGSESVLRSAAAAGDHDVATREYRHGDDLRRVHWRSTARRGELMVRREEQPHELQATVLLDVRGHGHRGMGVSASLEWAVTAAASVVVLLTSCGYAVRLVTDGLDLGWTGRRHDAGLTGLLDRLAVIGAAPASSLPDAVATVARRGGDGLLVAILGEVDETLVRPLAALPGLGTAGLALLIDTTQWFHLPPRQAEQIRKGAQGASRLLELSEWSTVHVGGTDTVATAWSRLIRQHAATSGVA
jgi:uncharacterized protein (DUF58 family)